MARFLHRELGTRVALDARMGAAVPIFDWLRLDRAIRSEVRVAQAPVVACSAIEIALVQEEPARRQIGGREVVVPDGHVLVVPRDAERTTTFTTAHLAAALWLGDDLVAQLAAALDDDPGVRRIAPGSFMVRSRKIEPLLRALADEVGGAPLGTTQAAEGLCESITIEMLSRARRSSASTSERDPRVRAAIGQMQSSVTDVLTVDDLARNANMRRFDFSRLFREEVGEAPFLFFLRLRVAHAVDLLRSGHVSLTEVALACGFSDSRRLSSAFKMHMGMLPYELLRSARSA